ncbi:DUF5666 domain-containing protein [Amycolatopsis pigmentata]|uniref:DUF5666 domain-containing protein n=1 Tax=Amycolatopsis pigmentata TaxID=450801 RepID=A0ABW5G656_9PSEU
MPKFGTRRPLAIAVLGSALVLTLAACGSSGSDSGAPASQPPSQARGARGGPAAAGTIAAVEGSDIQVQNPANGQVTVKFSGSTVFSQQTAAALADVTVGSCVLVAGTGSPVVARTVEISAAGGNGCGFGAPGGGARPENGNGNGAPPSRPSGAPRSGAPNQARPTAGKVTAVTSTGFTVEEDNRQTGATSDVQVTVDSGTTYGKTASADASALKVGECVAATGQTDDTGAVTARTIAISQAGPNGCTVGGAGGRQRGNGGGNGTGNGNG